MRSPRKIEKIEKIRAGKGRKKKEGAGENRKVRIMFSGELAALGC